MSDRKQETADDIIVEMRDLGKLDEKSSDKIPRSLMGLGLRTYADRLEAAWKREKNKIESDALFVGGLIEASRKRKSTAKKSLAVDDSATKREAVTDSHGFGDAAALREVLVAVKESIDGIGASSLDCDPTILMASLTQVCARLSARIERALAKPPRNCDKFREVDEAYNQFKRYVMRENPACTKPSPLYTLWDGLKWALGFADGEVGKPDAPKKVWIVFHEEHEAGGCTKTKVAHICDSRLKAEELLERDGAFIANMKDSDIRSVCYKGSKGDFDYRYYIEEMGVVE